MNGSTGTTTGGYTERATGSLPSSTSRRRKDRSHNKLSPKKPGRFTQSQHEITNEYKLDPTGRVLNTISGGKEIVNHYDGAGEAVAWTCELIAGKCEAASKWTRNIPGIDGALAAVQTNGGTPILQLHDLQGNIVATAELSSTATKLLSTYNSTEFGVPNAEKVPPTFAWLGASDVSKALSSGVITYGATSYVPQTGLALQTEQVETPGYPVAVGGGAPARFTEEAWVFQGAGREAAEAPGVGAAEQYEALEAACRVNPQACAGLGFGEDPEYKVLLTTRQAGVIAAGLRKGPNSLYKIAESGIIKGFTMNFAERFAELGKGYMIGAANGLKKCVSTIDAAYKAVARCKLFVLYEVIFGDKVTYGFGIETCYGDEEKLGGMTIVTFPYCIPAANPENVA